MNAMAMKASFSPIQELGPLVDYKEISRTCLPRLGCWSLSWGGWAGFAGEALQPAASVLQRATAAPWSASASRRRPSLRGRWFGDGGHRHFPAAAVAGPSPALMGKEKAPSFLARLRGRLGIQS